MNSRRALSEAKAEVARLTAMFAGEPSPFAEHRAYAAGADAALVALRKDVAWVNPLVWSEKEAAGIGAMRAAVLDLIDRAIKGER